MPFMERITWSGVALHEGPLPGYPASHGCIRMTHDFAERLWHVARLGVRVIVARTDVSPVDIAHPRLFGPKAKPSEPPVAGADPDKHAELLAPVQFVQATTVRFDTASQQVPPDREGLRGSTDIPNPAAVETTATVPAPTGEPAAPNTGPVVVETKPALADPPKPATDAVDPAKSAPMQTPGPRSPTSPSSAPERWRSSSVAREKAVRSPGFRTAIRRAGRDRAPRATAGTHVFTAWALPTTAPTCAGT